MMAGQWRRRAQGEPGRAPRSDSLRAGLMGDLRAFDPAALAWTDLAAASAGAPPAARYCHGFSAGGGRLFVFGGVGPNGSERPRPDGDPAPVSMTDPAITRPL